MKKLSLLFILFSLSGTSQVTQIADFPFRPDVIINGKDLETLQIRIIADINPGTGSSSSAEFLN
ncbi:hypothetical protein MTP09_07360 [Chryseobacterium suipulveris]|uniref:Uncharacterized protein n=1 Tax=Chryseobacterium suipulveris TaxID=2929800 RepID=A0ABY4BKM4_9FLAO|nr:hypothetical protein [Chryseobacterium suipulveris]UOE39743.1 hypothetical protein MTP09_07360 [Chryseobacterium suipulveris]